MPFSPTLISYGMHGRTSLTTHGQRLLADWLWIYTIKYYVPRRRLADLILKFAVNTAPVAQLPNTVLT